MRKDFKPSNNKYLTVRDEGPARWELSWPTIEIDYSKSSHASFRLWWDDKVKEKILPSRNNYINKRLKAIDSGRRQELVDRLEHSKGKVLDAVANDTEKTYRLMLAHINDLVSTPGYLGTLDLNELTKMWEMVLTNSGRSTKNTKQSSVTMTVDAMKDMSVDQQNKFKGLIMKEYNNAPSLQGGSSVKTKLQEVIDSGHMPPMADTSQPQPAQADNVEMVDADIVEVHEEVINV